MQRGLIPSIAHPAEFVFFSSLTRAWEFVAGALLALAPPKILGYARSRSSVWANGLAVLAALLLAVVAFEPALNTGRELLVLVAVAGTALAIAAGTIGTTWLGRVLGCRPLVWLGDRSYSLYLWHWPFVVFAGLAWPDWPTAAFLAIVLSLVPALVSYRYVEMPLRRRVARPRDVARFATAGIALTAVVSGGVVIGGNAAWWNDSIGAMSGRKGAWEDSVPGCRSIPHEEYTCDHVQPGATGSIILVGDSTRSHCHSRRRRPEDRSA